MSITVSCTASLYAGGGPTDAKEKNKIAEISTFFRNFVPNYLVKFNTTAFRNQTKN